ncbi:hypothetical protein HanIR_Chr14g0708651 [Helianthus annuus]|nr:hypothetical protein HanIR_Chr14g0708651 [Helianthus annuus]
MMEPSPFTKIMNNLLNLRGSHLLPYCKSTTTLLLVLASFQLLRLLISLFFFSSKLEFILLFSKR